MKGLEKELERRTAELQTIEQTLSDERTYSDMHLPDELNTLLAKAGKLRQTVESLEEQWMDTVEELESQPTGDEERIVRYTGRQTAGASMRRFPTTRLRRNREEDFVRRLVRENRVSADDLIYPMFVIDEANTQTDISSMPGISRLSVDLAVNEAKMLFELGLPAIALFPNVDATLRTLDGAEAYNDQGLVPTAVRAIKAAVPDLGIITDAALDPYTSHGQDGIVNADGYVEKNDITVEALRRQASVCAAAGADVIARRI